jgi:3-oxoacyl-[acyl-carrier-protein] synthase II
MRAPDPAIPLAVTGLGIVCSVGRNRSEVWRAIVDSRDGIGRLTRFPGETFPTDIAAEVDWTLEPSMAIDRRELKRLSRTDRLAVVAAAEAILQANSDASERLSLDATAVSTGSSTGGLLEGEAYYFSRLIRGRDRTPTSQVIQQPTSGPSDAVARLFALGGGVFSNATACASGGAAIGLGADVLRSGRAEAVLAGGSDALCRLTYSGFNVLQAVDSSPCAPFSADRKGITLGEGAAYLLLERMDDARRRGATVLAELAGYGASCDAHHPTAPIEDGRGAQAAMRQALAEGGAVPADIDYINAHGTGTLLNDSAESRAIVSAVGASVPVSSTKSFFGHTLGASGAVEAVITVLALMNGVAPPTLRLNRTAEDCLLDYIPHQARAIDMRAALSNTFGFGGSNVSLLFRRTE